MEQVHGVKAPGQEEAWEEVRTAAAVEAVVLQQARAGTASARTVAKKLHTNWERLAMNRTALSAGLP